MAPRKFAATLENSVPLSSSVKLLRFRLDAPLEFGAGQNLTLKAPNGEGGTRTKPYSIASPPALDGGRGVELCVQRAGPGSAWLHSATPGTRIDLEAPFGHFRLKGAAPSEVLFLAEGTGISPLRSMIRDLLEGSRPYGPSIPVRLFLSEGPAGAFLFEGEWRALERAHPNFRFVPVRGPWAGAPAGVQAQGRDSYLCGLTPFLGEATTALRGRGFAPPQIRFERFV